MRSMQEQRGLTLVEMLVGLLLSLLVATAASSMFFSSAKYSLDNDVIINAEERARSVLDKLVFDFRMTGAGLPLGQTDFVYTDTAVGNSALAVLLDSDESMAHVRFNEVGYTTALTSEFDANGSNTLLSVVDSGDFLEGDIVSVSDATVGGTDGLVGTVTSVSGNSLRVSNDYATASGSTFPSGSLVNRILDVSYTSLDDWGGVTRSSGGNTVTIAPGTRFELSYLDQSGNEISLPLSAAESANELSSIRVTVYARGNALLRDGSTYTAEAEQVVSLRNLIMSRS